MVQDNSQPPQSVIQPTGPTAPPPAAPNGPDFQTLYSGLDGLQDRVTPAQKDMFTALGKTTDNPLEATAKVINQLWAEERTGLPRDTIQSNWEAVKKTIAREEFGQEPSANYSDVAFYGTIGQQFAQNTPDAKDATAKANENFWGVPNAGGVKQAWDAMWQPVGKLPDPPDGLSTKSFFPDASGLSWLSPASAAAVYKGVKPYIEGGASPGGAAAILAGPELSIMSKTYPLAKAVLASMTGVFGGLMTIDYVKKAPETAKVLQDPNATTQEKITAATNELAAGAAGVLGVMGAAFEALPSAKAPEVAKSLEGKSPAEAEEILNEAAKENPTAAPELKAAATKLGELDRGPVSKPYSTDTKYGTGIPEPEEPLAGGYAGTKEALPHEEPPPEPAEEAAATETPEVEQKPATAAEQAVKEGGAIGIKNDSVNEELSQMGIEPPTKLEEGGFADTHAEALAEWKSDPTIGRKLVDDLVDDPRAPTPKQEVVLDFELNRARIERDNAGAQLDAAQKSGDPEAIKSALNEVARSRDYFQRVADISDKVGTKSGRSLAFRRLMVKQDYTLAGLERKFKTANLGKPLDAEQTAQLKEISAELEKTKAEFEAYRQRQGDKARPPPPRGAPRNAVSKFLSDQAEQARVRIRQRAASGRVQSGLDPLDLADHALVGADLIAKGVTDLGKWSAEMVKEFGERIKPYLKDVWNKSQDVRDDVTVNQKLLARKNQLLADIKELQKKVDEGDLSTKPTNKNRPAVPELETLQQKRDSLSDELKRMRETDSKVKDLEAAIAKKERKIKEGDLSPQGLPKNRPSVEALETLRQQRDQLNKDLAEARKGAAKPSQQEIITKKVEALNERISEKKAALASGDIEPKAKAANRPQVEEIEKAKQELEQLNKQLAEARKGPPKTADEIRLAAYKTRTGKSIETLKGQIESGDFSKEPRKPIPLDDEARRLRNQHEKIKRLADLTEAKIKADNRPNWEKAMEQVSGTARAAALSGTSTLAKLVDYSAWKLAMIPLHEATATVLSKIPGFDRVFDKSSFEGGASVKSLARFYTAFATKGMEAAAEQMRRGTTVAKESSGKKVEVPHWFDFPGRLHAAIKAPLLTAADEMYRYKLEQKAAANGIDLSNEMVRGAMNIESYKYANRQILQESNQFADTINGAMDKMRATNPKTGKASIAKSAIATAIETLFTKGIIKTPANYVMQTLEQNPVSGAYALGKSEFWKAAVEPLKDEEATTIARLLTAGAIGTAGAIWGIADAMKAPKDRVFGGYYQPGEKRDKTDVPFGSIRVGGYVLPQIASHNPVIENIQLFETMTRVALSHMSKKDRENKGLVTGVVVALISLAEEAPVANQALRIGRITEPGQQSSVVGQTVKNLIPVLSQNIATYTDTDSKGDEIKRQTKTVGDYVKSGIPVLREELPKRSAGKSHSLPDQ